MRRYGAASAIFVTYAVSSLLHVSSVLNICCCFFIRNTHDEIISGTFLVTSLLVFNDAFRRGKEEGREKRSEKVTTS